MTNSQNHKAKSASPDPQEVKPDVAKAGVIRADEVYAMKEFRQRLGLTGKWAWRKILRQGLRTIRIGNARFVRGQDFVAFLDEQAKKQVEPKAR